MSLSHRNCSGSKFFRSEMDQEQRKKYRTECWLERSIFEEKHCDPEAHVSFTPLGIEVPLPSEFTDPTFRIRPLTIYVFRCRKSTYQFLWFR